jgi:hypothetical protein
LMTGLSCWMSKHKLQSTARNPEGAHMPTQSFKQVLIAAGMNIALTTVTQP